MRQLRRQDPRPRPAGLAHPEWLADGPADPREAMACAVLAACADAATVLAYNVPFEKSCISVLPDAVPSLASRLRRLADRVADLPPIVCDHVYHPDFLGSFSIKSVLPALVEGMGHDDLDIRDGEAASLALEAMRLSPGDLPPFACAKGSR